MLRLIFRHLSGSRRGTVEVYPTARLHNLTIGRDPGSDLRFHAELDAVVSRQHAVIEWKTSAGGMTRFVLVDLLSSNGTFVNGEVLPVEGRDLQTGDRIQFGHSGPDVQIEIDELPDAADVHASSPRPRVGQTQQLPIVTLLNGRRLNQDDESGV